MYHAQRVRWRGYTSSYRIVADTLPLPDPGRDTSGPYGYWFTGKSSYDHRQVCVAMHYRLRHRWPSH